MQQVAIDVEEHVPTRAFGHHVAGPDLLEHRAWRVQAVGFPGRKITLIRRQCADGGFDLGSGTKPDGVTSNVLRQSIAPDRRRARRDSRSSTWRKSGRLSLSTPTADDAGASSEATNVMISRFA